MNRHWPLHGLRITTETLEMRIPNDELLEELVDVARQGIHDPQSMPFLVPWTDTPEEQFPEQFLQFHWTLRANMKPTGWVLNFAVLRNGIAVGAQGIEASDFATLRTFTTGSWLGQAHQRQGIGLEMRRAMLTFAFDHLGAEVAHSSALDGNLASSGVSRRIGYESNGWDLVAPRGVPVRQQRFILTRQRWEELGARLPITVEGLEPCRALLGA